jgi:uncharacterized membrane protein
MDKLKRSVAKSVTWRLWAIIILCGLGWIFTGNIEQTASLTISFTVIQFLLYYFHERIWERIKWGQERV